MKKLVLLLAVFLISSWGVGNLYSQEVDLVELQKKEKERRKKLKKSKTTLTNDNLNEVKGGEKKAGFTQVKTTGVSPGAKPQDKESEDSTKKDVSPEEDPKKTPEYWRALKARLTGEIAELEKLIASQQLELNKLWTDYNIMDLPLQKRDLKQRLDQLTARQERSKARLKELQDQLENLAREARKAGVPPGWLR